jgi:hypothetical protein
MKPSSTLSSHVHMSGPHPFRIHPKAPTRPIWRVAIMAVGSEAPTGRVYRCMTFRRAANLACDMARDRRLMLRVEAACR